MSRPFVRSARWLRSIFTPSVTPGDIDPGIVSSDVSLTHPWEGSGAEIDPSVNNHFITVNSAVQAAADTLIGTVPAAEVWRLVAFGVEFIAGTAPIANVTLTSPNGSTVALSEFKTLAGATGETDSFSLSSVGPVLALPGVIVGGSHHSGDGLTQLTWTLYLHRGPLGSLIRG